MENYIDITTPNGKDLFLKISLKLEDTIENREKVHKIREEVEKLQAYRRELSSNKCPKSKDTTNGGKK